MAQPHEDDLTREHRSFCRFCQALCGIVVRTQGTTVLDVRGDPEHPLSRGYTCPKAGRSAHGITTLTG
jgi:anaerobic selenocysteine-containing dehydrogenase